MRKRYYAVWTAVLTVIVGALAVIAGFTNGQYIMFTVFAALLLALTALLFFAPTSKSLAKEQWLFRVQTFSLTSYHKPRQNSILFTR